MADASITAPSANSTHDNDDGLISIGTTVTGTPSAHSVVAQILQAGAVIRESAMVNLVDDDWAGTIDPVGLPIQQLELKVVPLVEDLSDTQNITITD